METTKATSSSSQLSLLDSSPETCPLVHSRNAAESTPQLYYNNPKKRKFTDFLQNILQNRDELELDDFAEICSSTPQASSTLNESRLSRQFQNIQIQQSYPFMEDCEEPATKLLKTNDCGKLVTPPSTPESHLKVFDSTPKKTGIFSKCSSACSVPSPLKEQHDILYSKLKPLPPLRKSATPQKILEKIDKVESDKCRNKNVMVVEKRSSDKLPLILNAVEVMDKIFSYLSNGDLFRFSQVNEEFESALFMSSKAYRRFLIFKEGHKTNKENYKITPPSSPENQDLFPQGSLSPNSRKFAEFVETGSHLNPNQSLTKCPKCIRPSVVENSIAQCNSCGYIYCQKCDSFAYNPEEFFDKCQGLVLSLSSVKRRTKLDDLTNYSLDFNASSILNSTAELQNFSSGYYSGYESSHTPMSVKRNLSSSFAAEENRNQSKSLKALFEHNKSHNRSVTTAVKDKRQSLSNIAPVVKSSTLRRKIQVVEPSSPPKVKIHAIGSKESRRNLKRLTR